MFDGKMKAVLLSIALSVAGLAHGQTNSIVGEWSTSEILSQLGPSVTSYSFTASGSFTVTTKFTHGQIPDMSATGTYHATANTITLVADSRTNTASYHFESATLVIDEGRPSKIFRLTKKK